MSEDGRPLDPAQAFLARWQAEGDEEALDQLLRLEMRELAARLRSRSGGQLRASVSASDLAQEAVMRMLRKDEPPVFETPAALRAYLWKSAWRLFLNRVQAPSRRVRRMGDFDSQEMSAAVAADGGGGPEQAAASERDLAIQLTLNLLKPDDCDILTRVYFQHQDVDSIASELGLQRPAVEMRLTRARRRMAEKLSDWTEIIG